MVCWTAFEVFHHFYVIKDSVFLSETIKVTDDFTTSTNGFGEVIFQGSIWSGVIMFIAVFISNPVAALYGFIGSAGAAMIAAQYAEPLMQVHVGLFSFNAVLCAITFSGTEKRMGFGFLYP